MSTAADMLALYLAAEADILTHGQSSAIDGRTLTLADLEMIRAGRAEWERKAAAAAAVARGGTSGYRLARMD